MTENRARRAQIAATLRRSGRWSTAPSTALVDAALLLAERGRPVFPLQESGDNAKAPRVAGGFKSATRDPDQIRRWWSRWPNALIGCPVPVGQLAIDVDPRHGGSLENLERAAGGPLPATLTAWSGRQDGGRHLFFACPLDRFTSTRLPPGIDLRIGGRHYLVTPPSPHPATGRPYRWGACPNVAVLPTGLLELLRPPPLVPVQRSAADPDRRADGLIRVVAQATPGGRNDALYWSALTAFEADLDITSELTDAAAAAGLPASQIARTIASAARKAGR